VLKEACKSCDKTEQETSMDREPYSLDLRKYVVAAIRGLYNHEHVPILIGSALPARALSPRRVSRWSLQH
jgi:hypothetical protein